MNSSIGSLWNDFLMFGGACFVLAGCYLITPALALVALGLILMAAGLARMRGSHGSD
jgi:hypothetical protein